MRLGRQRLYRVQAHCWRRYYITVHYGPGLADTIGWLAPRPSIVARCYL